METDGKLTKVFDKKKRIFERKSMEQNKSDGFR